MIQGLNEGDLFSTGDQAYWNNTLNTDARAVKLLYKTATPYPIEDKDKQVYKVEFVEEEELKGVAEVDVKEIETKVATNYQPYGDADSD